MVSGLCFHIPIKETPSNILWKLFELKEVIRIVENTEVETMHLPWPASVNSTVTLKKE